MSDISAGFEALQSPYTKALSHLTEIGLSVPLISPEIKDAEVCLALFNGGERTDRLNFGFLGEEVVIDSPHGMLTNYCSAYVPDMYRYLTIGEVVSQGPDGFILGLGFDSPEENFEDLVLSQDAAQIFVPSGSILTKILDQSMDLRYTTSKDAIHLSPDLKRHLLIARCFTYLQDEIPADKDGENKNGEDTATGPTAAQIIRIQSETDNALQLAANLAYELPELSDRATLTRYLLYLLKPKSRLYGNEMALEESARLIGKGVVPFAFPDILSLVQESVHSAVANYTDATKYL